MPIENASNRTAEAAATKEEIRILAECALAVVANRIAPCGRRTEAAMVRDLCNAMLQQNRTHQNLALSRMAANDIGTAEICEKYLPAVARMLGDRWVRDELSFVQVTHGAYRLQEVIRSYGRQYAKAGMSVPTPQAVLICVPDFEQHCLGAFLAADQFRRLGAWVQLGIGFGADEIIAAARRQDYAMIGLSAASTKSVVPLCRLVDKLQIALNRRNPIVIGGNVVNCGVDLKRETGADLVTADVARAFQCLEPAQGEKQPDA